MTRRPLECPVVALTMVTGSWLLAAYCTPAAALAQVPPVAANAPQLNPAQMLERFGVAASQQASFFNDQPLSPSEQDVLAKVLYHLPRLGRDNLHRWRRANLPLAELRAQPAEHRFEVYGLRGRATLVAKQALLPEQAELYEFEHYYLVTLLLEGSPEQALVAVRNVPAAWPLDTPLNEPAEATGLFLKTGDAASQPQPFLFAAERVAWFPDKPAAEWSIGQGDVALARAGFDIGLWDDVRSSREHALAAADREAFYQLLAVLGQSNAAAISQAVSEAPDVAQLLSAAAAHQGEIFPVEGLARRVMRVPVSDADVRARFGIDHYYEIDFFLPLRAASLRLGKPGKDAQGPVFQNEFPATLIVRRLPAGLEEGENVHQLIAADAVFFKVWAYRSAYATRFNQLQPAPLFVAAAPRVVTVETTGNWLTGMLVLVALGLALAVVVVILWSQVGRRKQRKRPPEPTTFDFRP